MQAPPNGSVTSGLVEPSIQRDDVWQVFFWFQGWVGRSRGTAANVGHMWVPLSGAFSFYQCRVDVATMSRLLLACSKCIYLSGNGEKRR
ncbi:hypothetical protein NDU88_006187 [Pleurodeles waltl]|uniref:Uncharacterized protein n=1 Tax=Pleurodeles waltl TaxID=8319 RepID=A0AAV7N081_PLEWA|nr:hypothetical protein NDU88_006187 [Pleurodeles waltl]